MTHSDKALIDEILEALKAGGESYDFDKIDAAFAVEKLVQAERRKAVEEAIPIALKILTEDPRILIADDVDEVAAGKEMARKIRAALFPPPSSPY